MPKGQTCRGYCTRCEEWKDCYRWFTCEDSGRRSICHSCGARAAHAKAKERARAEAHRELSEWEAEDDLEDRLSQLASVPGSPISPLSAPNIPAAIPSDVVRSVGPRLAYLQEADHRHQEDVRSREAGHQPDSTIAPTVQLGRDASTPIVVSKSDDEHLCERQKHRNHRIAGTPAPVSSNSSTEHNGRAKNTPDEVEELSNSSRNTMHESGPRTERSAARQSHREEQLEEVYQGTEENTGKRQILLAAADQYLKRRKQECDLLTDLRDALRDQIDRSATADSDKIILQAKIRRQGNEIQKLKELMKPDEERNERNFKRIRELEAESDGKQRQIDHLEKRVRRLTEGVEKWYERMKEED